MEGDARFGELEDRLVPVGCGLSTGQVGQQGEGDGAGDQPKGLAKTGAAQIHQRRDASFDRCAPV